MDELKNILPVDNINTDAAVSTLSKRESGSLIVLFIVVIIVLLGFIIFLAINSNPQCTEEKKALREDLAKRDMRITFLENSRDLINGENIALKDSLTKYQFINNFNAKAGEKQITLEAKGRN